MKKILSLLFCLLLSIALTGCNITDKALTKATQNIDEYSLTESKQIGSFSYLADKDWDEKINDDKVYYYPLTDEDSMLMVYDLGTLSDNGLDTLDNITWKSYRDGVLKSFGTSDYDDEEIDINGNTAYHLSTYNESTDDKTQIDLYLININGNLANVIFGEVDEIESGYSNVAKDVAESISYVAIDASNDKDKGEVEASKTDDNTVTNTEESNSSSDAISNNNITVETPVIVAAPKLEKVLYMLDNATYSSSYWQLTVGDTKNTTITYTPSDVEHGTVSYSSSDTSVATVDKNGKITAVSAGTAKITAVCDGISDYVAIKVSNKVTKTTSAATTTTTNKAATNNTGSSSRYVWLSATGSKYHSINNCGRMNPNKAYQVTEADAIAQGYGKCSKCW